MLSKSIFLGFRSKFCSEKSYEIILIVEVNSLLTNDGSHVLYASGGAM